MNTKAKWLKLVITIDVPNIIWPFGAIIDVVSSDDETEPLRLRDQQPSGFDERRFLLQQGHGHLLISGASPCNQVSLHLMQVPSQ